MNATMEFDFKLFDHLRPLPRVIEIDTTLLPDPWPEFCEAQRIRVHAVLGYENPAKHIKIWPACNIVGRGIQRGAHLNTDTVTDSSSGNYVLGLNRVLHAVRNRYPDFPIIRVVSVVPRNTPQGKLDLLEAAGIEIEFGEDSLDAMRRAETLAAEHGWWYTRQYWNPDNTEAYGPFGSHVAQSLPNVGIFACGVGSGGTCSGVIPALREGLRPHGSNLHAVAVVVESGSAVSGVRTEKALKPGTLDWRGVVNDVRYIRLEESLVCSAALWRCDPGSSVFEPCYGGESTGFALVGGLLSASALANMNRLGTFRRPDGNVHLGFIAPDMRDPYRDNFAKHGIFF